MISNSNPPVSRGHDDRVGTPNPISKLVGRPSDLHRHRAPIAEASNGLGCRFVIKFDKCYSEKTWRFFPFAL